MFTTCLWIGLLILAGFFVFMKLAPRTSMEELGHLLSLDEEALLERKLHHGPIGEGGTLIDFTVYGDYLQCRYLSAYCDNTYIQDIWIVGLATKTSLFVQFEDGELCLLEFRANPFVNSGVSFSGKSCLRKMGLERFLAEHALAVVELKVQKELKKLPEAQIA